MERIREAIEKSRSSDDRTVGAKPVPSQNESASSRAFPRPGVENVLWSPPRVQVNPAHLERQRVVSFSKADASHVAFDILRTKVFQTLRDNRWTSVAITSPKPRCGKTLVAANLAISMARQSDCRTVLVDLDLKRPSVAKKLGVPLRKSITQYVEGKAELEECFVAMGENLFLGLNAYPIKNSAEVIRHHSIREILPIVMQTLRPDVVLFDLPPMLTSDDVIAFLPQVDCGLLVVAAGETTPKEIEECGRQFEGSAHFLGVVLNKCQDLSEEYYQYGPH